MLRPVDWHRMERSKGSLSKRSNVADFSTTSERCRARYWRRSANAEFDIPVGSAAEPCSIGDTLMLAEDERARRLFPAGLRTVLRITQRWRLSDHEVCLLLDTSVPTLAAWRTGSYLNATEETLERLSLILGIYRGIAELLPVPERADEWIHKANSAEPFCGNSAIEFILQDHAPIHTLRMVRNYLDAFSGVPLRRMPS